MIDAEQKAVEVQEKLQKIEQFEPSQFLKMACDIYIKLVNKLEDIEDVNTREGFYVA